MSSPVQFKVDAENSDFVALMMQQDLVFRQKSLALLLRSLAFESDPREFDDVSSMILEVLHAMIKSRNLKFAARIVQTVNGLAESTSNPSLENARLMREFAKKVYSDATLEALLLYVENHATRLDRDFFPLIKFMSNQKPMFVLRFLVHERMNALREHLVENLATTDDVWLGPLYHLLIDHPVLTPHIRELVRLSGTQHVPSIMARLFKDQNPTQRRNIVLAMRHTQADKARGIMMRALYDHHPTVRMAALETMATFSDRIFLQDLLGFVRSEVFITHSLEERECALKTLGTIGQDDVVDVFRGILLKRNFTLNRRDNENKMIAVEVLTQIDSEASRNVLAEARDKRFFSRSLRTSLHA